ncbi:DUF4145 domain-containing protein [Ammonicoccus fulvus]|uniref:DUF4145 domain-containing protein n=1 Tax=Ammonicoccus fulvus TaxID=3138240 RepID=A0ABZ3FLG6_9ACTN
MGNFDFLAQTLPGSYPECARAESYAVSDPRTALFYARRAIEELVRYLYDLRALEWPYSDDLSALTNAPPFQQLAGAKIVQKLNAIRKIANKAVHDNVLIRPDVALRVLDDLFHLMVWATFHHSSQPKAAPTGARFDPQLAKKAAPLTAQQVTQLAQKFKAQDEAYRKKLAEHQEIAAAKDAEIAELQALVKAAQAANTQVDDHDYSEAQTRDLFIDVLLAEAGWVSTGSSANVTYEYPVTGMPNQAGTGYIDYVLWGADGLPLAVIEANERPRARRPANSRPSCTPTASKPSSIAVRSSSSPMAIPTISGTMPAAIRPVRCKDSSPATSWNC